MPFKTNLANTQIDQTQTQTHKSARTAQHPKPMKTTPLNPPQSITSFPHQSLSHISLPLGREAAAVDSPQRRPGAGAGRTRGGSQQSCGTRPPPTGQTPRSRCARSAAASRSPADCWAWGTPRTAGRRRRRQWPAEAREGAAGGGGPPRHVIPSQHNWEMMIFSG